MWGKELICFWSRCNLFELIPFQVSCNWGQFTFSDVAVAVFDLLCLCFIVFRFKFYGPFPCKFEAYLDLMCRDNALRNVVHQ